MRSIRIEVLPEHQQTPLAARSRFARTFSAWCCSPRPSRSEWNLSVRRSEPLKADDPCDIATGFTLALAGTSMTFLIWPGKNELARFERGSSTYELLRQPIQTVYSPPPEPKRAEGTLLQVRRLLGRM